MQVTTTRGTVDAGALVLAPGRWAPDLTQGLEVPLVVEERVQHWFAPCRPADFAPGALPVWVWERADGTALYGVPALGPDGSVKAAVHFRSTAACRVVVHGRGRATSLADLLPGLGDQHVRSVACWYTLTPDSTS